LREETIVTYNTVGNWRVGVVQRVGVLMRGCGWLFTEWVGTAWLQLRDRWW